MSIVVTVICEQQAVNHNNTSNVVNSHAIYCRIHQLPKRFKFLSEKFQQSGSAENQSGSLQEQC